MILLATMTLLTLTATVMAGPGHGDKPGDKLFDTGEAVTEALKQFKKDNTEDAVDLYKGIRSSPKKGGISVKVYLTDSTNQTYSCHRHDTSEPFECHLAD